jgi:cell division protein FtsB
MAKDEKASSEVGRSGLIKAANTPLGFFALVLTVMETILGVLSGTSFTGEHRTIAICGMLGTILILIAVVSWFAYHRPEALSGVSKPNVNIDELTKPLNAELGKAKKENDRIRLENARLEQQLANLNSMRSRIWAILARDSATLRDMFNHLDLLTDPAGRDQVLAIVGSLAEDGHIEADTSRPAGYYRLKKKEVAK